MSQKLLNLRFCGDLVSLFSYQHCVAIKTCFSYAILLFDAMSHSIRFLKNYVKRLVVNEEERQWVRSCRDKEL